MDGFILGVYIMLGFLILLTIIYAYSALILRQMRRKSPWLILTAGLPGLLLLAGVAGSIFS